MHAMIFAACGTTDQPSSGAATVMSSSFLRPPTAAAVETSAAGSTMVVTGPSFSVGAGSTTPAAVAWVKPVTGVEFLGAVDGVLYLTTDSSVMAIDLSDGSTIWKHQADDYWSDGESQISLKDRLLWVFAPYNASLLLDPKTGVTISLDAEVGAEPPAGFVPLLFMAPSPRVENGVNGARQVSDDGSMRWSLEVRSTGNYEGGPVIQVGDLIIVPAVDDHMYAIRVGKSQ
jgi:hypothetical protein